MYLLGIDVGTTHCKAGVFREDGAALAIAVRPTATRRGPDGLPYYDPDELWRTVAAAAASAVAEAVVASDLGVAAVGIASMAETGLLLERMGRSPGDIDYVLFLAPPISS